MGTSVVTAWFPFPPFVARKLFLNDIKTQKQKDLTEMLSKLELSDEIDVDEAVTAAAPLFRQLLNAYAEESATEDALYFLGKYLDITLMNIYLS